MAFFYKLRSRGYKLRRIRFLGIHCLTSSWRWLDKVDSQIRSVESKTDREIFRFLDDRILLLHLQLHTLCTACLHRSSNFVSIWFITVRDRPRSWYMSYIWEITRTWETGDPCVRLECLTNIAASIFGILRRIRVTWMSHKLISHNVISEWILNVVVKQLSRRRLSWDLGDRYRYRYKI